MDDRHRGRLRHVLQGIGLNSRECASLEGRCIGWWPSLAAFVVDRLGELGELAPESALEQLGQDWIDEERISVFADEGDGLAPAGVFVFRVGWW